MTSTLRALPQASFKFPDVVPVSLEGLHSIEALLASVVVACSRISCMIEQIKVNLVPNAPADPTATAANESQKDDTSPMEGDFITAASPVSGEVAESSSNMEGELMTSASPVSGDIANLLPDALAVLLQKGEPAAVELLLNESLDSTAQLLLKSESAPVAEDTSTFRTAMPAALPLRGDVATFVSRVVGSSFLEGHLMISASPVGGDMATAAIEQDEMITTEVPAASPTVSQTVAQALAPTVPTTEATPHFFATQVDASTPLTFEQLFDRADERPAKQMDAMDDRMEQTFARHEAATFRHFGLLMKKLDEKEL